MHIHINVAAEKIIIKTVRPMKFNKTFAVPMVFEGQFATSSTHYQYIPESSEAFNMAFSYSVQSGATNVWKRK